MINEKDLKVYIWLEYKNWEKESLGCSIFTWEGADVHVLKDTGEPCLRDIADQKEFAFLLALMEKDADCRTFGIGQICYWR